MDSAFYAACAGLQAQSKALEVVAHNLANLNTAGFHGDQATFQSLLAVSRTAAPNVLSNVLNSVLNSVVRLVSLRSVASVASTSATSWCWVGKPWACDDPW